MRISFCLGSHATIGAKSLGQDLDLQQSDGACRGRGQRAGQSVPQTLSVQRYSSSLRAVLAGEGGLGGDRLSLGRSSRALGLYVSWLMRWRS